MTLQIATDNTIIINNRNTGLKIAQTREETIIYKPENKATSQKYQAIAMPHTRYSAAHDNPKPIHATPELAAKFKTAGRAQLEADLVAILGV